jgi:holdfast attachment protein HfaA
MDFRVLFLLAALGAATPASAQVAGSVGDFERGFGMEAQGFDDPIAAGTRDPHGNRLILNGRMMSQSTLVGGLQDAGFSDSLSAQAIANQLTIVTQGSWNTVIVDSTQINSGDVIATVNGDAQ